jgi:DNA-binding NarL/FixJ family response regulator
MAYKILIVDDSKLARMSVAKLLKTLRPGWLRLEAGNAEEALAAMAADRPDVVLLDFNMPGRDGLDVAAQLQRAYPEIPVAVISANIQIEVVARAGDAGAAFLPKPLTEEVLATFLSAVEPRLLAKT